jgi:hypothetical protein
LKRFHGIGNEVKFDSKRSPIYDEKAGPPIMGHPRRTCKRGIDLSQTSPVNTPPVSFQDGQLSGAPVRDRRIPAWLLSAFLHVAILILLFWLMSSFQNGSSDVENRSGGIVLVDSTELATEYLSEGQVDHAESPSEVADSAPPIVAESQLPPEFPGLEVSESSVTGAGESLAESLDRGAPNMEAVINDSQTNVEVGGKVTTEVFGIKGTGTRFVYLFDRSKSMEDFGRRPLLAARQELLQSLDSLTQAHQFQIVFYNNRTKVFNFDGEPKMYFASDDVKESAKRFVQNVNGDASTDHVNAVKYALSLAPDVIFMLTDAEGGFTRAELAALSRANRAATVINTIEFGRRQGVDQSLRKLAEETGGNYLFKDLDSLRLK